MVDPEAKLQKEMTSIVCDASVLFKTLVVEADSDRAEAVVDRFSLIVPDILYGEIGNALWTRVRTGQISVARAQSLISLLGLSVFDSRPIQPFIPRALLVAATLDHPIYDCIYLALAESLNLPFVTADARFLRALRRYPFPAVTALADFG
jgi:predicted nucleic acid-binding protein